jgi:hypothetical protein
MKRHELLNLIGTGMQLLAIGIALAGGLYGTALCEAAISVGLAWFLWRKDLKT